MMTLTTERRPTKTQFVRWLNDNPPVEHPLYAPYALHSAKTGRTPSLRTKCFGEYLYSQHKPYFDVLWDELVANPDRWAAIKEGR